MTGNTPQMKFSFIIKGKSMYLLVSHNKLTKFTKVSIGKHISTVKGKKLSQKEIWPIILVCTDLNLKIEVTYDDRENIFMV